MDRQPNDEELIRSAADIICTKQIGSYKFGHVGCALLTSEGSVYRGVALDLSSGLGFCAERTAISQMITNKEYKIKKIVSVWIDKEGNDYVLPPCGSCLQFMKLVAEDKDDMQVILGKDKTATLQELLPVDWWANRTLVPSEN